MRYALPLLVCCTLIALSTTTMAQHSQDEGLNWKAFWVWGTKNTRGGKGFFRLPFRATSPVRSAIVQGSGDDGYELFINGHKVRSSGFGFNRTDKTDLTPHVREGANLLAAVCTNAAFPGGWLAQLHLVYQDGNEETVISDHSTRFHHEEEVGWTQDGFDDGHWESCTEIARPPQGVWGPLPLEYAGVRRRLQLVTLGAPSAVSAGEDLQARLVVRCFSVSAKRAELSIQVARDGAQLGSLRVPVVPPASGWAPGADITIGPVAVPINGYAPSGAAELTLALTGCTFDDIGTSLTREVNVTGREGQLRIPRARVAEHMGAPALFVDDEPLPAMLYLQGRSPIPAEYAQMARAGYRVFSLGLPLGWTGHEQYDYASVDATMLAVLAGAPDGYFIPRVSVSAPAWWCEAHPDELIKCADWTGWVDDVWGGTKHQSFASALWREQAGEALRRLIEHIRTSTYADRVIGYHVASGIYGEWHLWSPPHLPDVSRPMREAFIRWAQQRYEGDMKALNLAWGSKLASLDEIACATQEERFSSDLGVFKDLSKSRHVADYWRCLHETSVEAINHFCKIVKEATDRRAVTGVFYAYLTDIGWPQEGGHLAAHRAMTSPDIDFFSSPHTYSHRAMGEDGAFRAYPASIALHGKLFIDEGDDRTHLSGDKPYMHAQNIEQDIAIMRREGLNVLTNRVGAWWFDMTTGWFNDSRLLDTAAQLRAIGQSTLDRPRESYSEIALVYDPTVYYALADWKTQKDALDLPLCNEQFRQMQRVGAPYDVLLLDDLFHPRSRNYKCYIFANTWQMLDQQRQQILTRLQRDGKALIFAYAPGFSSPDGLNVEHIAQLTGMQFEQRSDAAGMQVVNTDDAGEEPVLTPGAKWGPDKTMAPRFAVKPEGCRVLAHWLDDDTPAVAAAEHAGWLSVYCGTGPIPAPLIAWAAKQAGVHIWTEAWRGGANFYAGNGLMGLHTAQEGAHTFALPWSATVRDATTGREMLKDGRTFTVQLPRWTTAIYALERVP